MNEADKIWEAWLEKTGNTYEPWERAEVERTTVYHYHKLDWLIKALKRELWEAFKGGQV